MTSGLEYIPTYEERHTVKTLSSFGHSQREIAQYLRINKRTLEKHFVDELKVGKIHLTMKCGGFLLEVVDDDTYKPKERLDAAKFILSRICGWTEKTLQDSSIDTMASAIREGVEAVSLAKHKSPNGKDAEDERDTA